jgi:hypothetical protein
MNKYIIASTFFTLITSSAAYAFTPYNENTWGDGWTSSAPYAATIEVDQEVGDSAILMTAEEFAAQAGTSCRKKRIIKTDDSICTVLKKPEDMNPAKLPGAAQNPFTEGCDFSAFEFPGLPSFGGGLGGLGGLVDDGLGALGQLGSAIGGGFVKDTLCDLTAGLVNPMLNGVNNDMRENVELMLFDVMGEDVTAVGNAINSVKGASDPANYLKTVNKIKNALNAVQ